MSQVLFSLSLSGISSLLFCSLSSPSLTRSLSSKAYRDKLRESDAAPRVTESSEPFMPDETHAADRSGTWDVLDYQPGEGIDLEDTLRNKPAKHFRLRELSFTDLQEFADGNEIEFEEGTTSFFCKIFFAEQFDALRHNCGCADQFVESLARCVKWDSSGGKSKVDFLKTKGISLLLFFLNSEADPILR